MTKPTSLRQRVIDMEVGESLVIKEGDTGFNNTRTYASEIGYALNRKYSTHRDRTNRTNTIIRIS